MKKTYTILATALLLGFSASLASCGADNQQSVPDNQSIETPDIDSDSTEDTSVDNAGGGTGTTTGSTGGSTTM